MTPIVAPLTDPAAERLRLRVLIDELSKEAGSATGMVTLYIPASRSPLDVRKRLSAEMAQAGNIKDRVNRKAVTDALTSALTQLNLMVPGNSKVPPNGIAIFASESKSVNIIPPEPIASYVYHCAPGFDVGPLREMLAPKQVYGLVVMDRKEASVGFLRGSVIEPVASTESHILGKHRAGGQSANRYARQIEHATDDFYQQVAEMASGIFLSKVDSLSGVLVGGPGDTKTEWLLTEKLDYRVRAKVVQPLFETGYTDDSQGLKELVAAASKTMQDLVATKEEHALIDFFVSAVIGGYAYGPAETLKCMREGRAGLLLISDGIKDPEEYLVAARGCSAKVVVVSADSDSGRRFLMGFGGIAARLRWRDNHDEHF